MNYTDLFSHNHQKGCWQYHLEWCTKYRFCALRKESIRKDCESALLEAAQKKGMKLLELAVQPEHVHCIAECSAPADTRKLLFYLKGYSSHQLFKKHPNLRLRYWNGHFWSRGSFSRTIGADVQVAREYVRHQTDIHQKKLTEFA